MSDKMKDVLKSVWQFCSYMFWLGGGKNTKNNKSNKI